MDIESVLNHNYHFASFIIKQKYASKFCEFDCCIFYILGGILYRNFNLFTLTYHFKLLLSWCTYCSNPLLFTSHIYIFLFSDAENVTDSQFPFLPSVEVLVKALVVIAPGASARGPDTCLQLLLCSHHPCLVGSGKKDAVWKVYLLLMHFFHHLLCYFGIVFFFRINWNTTFLFFSDLIVPFSIYYFWQ